MTSGISSWAIRRPIPTIVLFLALVIVGLASFMRLPVNANPQVTFPVVTVTVTQRGAAPAELETQVTRKIENMIAGLSGVRHIQSTIADGSSETTVEFRLGVDPDRATNDVRDAVSQIRADLPQGIDEPIITRLDIEGSAILYYTVQAPHMSPVDLSWFVENAIGRDLLSVPGVQRIQRLGGVSREVRVALDPDRLAALNITADFVNTQLRALNADVPGGRGEVGAREQSIRTLGSAPSVAALAATPIPLPGNRWVKLSDIAVVSDGASEPRELAHFDGEPAVGFSVSRARGSSDTVVAEAVSRRVAAIQARSPGVTIREVVSTVEYTHESYKAAMEALVEGAILTVIVVFAFLRDWRATVIAALAMPLSILPTFLAMDLLGFTLNSISLLALTLVVGILVDDAIVEIENIDRHIHMGKRPFLASIDAADAIGLAVVATTLTIVAVFAPVSFVGGVVGQYFRQFGLTVAIAVLASLLVARLLTPLMAAYFLLPKVQPAAGSPSKPSRLAGWYHRLLSWTLDHRRTTLGAAAAVFIGSLVLVPLLPTGFMPTGDNNLTQIKVELPPGSLLSDTDRVTRRIAHDLRRRSEVAHVFVMITEVRQARVLTVLKPRAERKVSRRAFEQSVQLMLANVPDIRFTFLADAGARDVSIILVGDDPVRLAAAARALETEMRGLLQVANVESTEPLPRPELVIRPRFHEAARLAVSVEAIGTVARIATVGQIDAYSAKFNFGDRQVPVRVMLRSEARADLDALRQLRVGRDNGGAVPLTSVADIGFADGEARIERQDRRRRIAVEADLNGVALGTALAAIAELPTLRMLPEGIEQIEYGDAEYMSEMFESFGTAMAMGVLAVLAVLILLFRDFLQPVTILIALPLSIGGAVLALLAYGAALDLSSTIGLLMLMGIVTKNSILLVDFAMTRQQAGVPRRAALLEAGAVRARPIIMTTVAMVAGMIPAAMGVGADAGFRAPMAVAVIGGLLASTVLSLVFVPVAFTCMDDVRAWLGRHLGWLTSVTADDRATAERTTARPGEPA
ncbi:efflux RND transporter permease subunit [Reyranella sp. CPCC 100927]|uniref:efflux RND transporter permease subunit n=1 Tax=Reyranella sp. CPCC 100927 TaxID=2599616 RepID=UPI0011B5AED3|nr:efflux RND transporter permease subunit [Reyranella sp. CPCC 100927]TWT15498.1 efflux RND transporter permease subunit [Reyranella sp. CPCC 100927]